MKTSKPHSSDSDSDSDGTVLLSDVDGVAYPYVEMLSAALNCDRAAGETAPVTAYPDSYRLSDAWQVTQDALNRAHLSLFESPEAHDDLDRIDEPEVRAAADRRLRDYRLLLEDAVDGGARLVFLTRRAHYTRSIGGCFDTAAERTQRWLEDRYPPHSLLCVDDKTDYAGPGILLIDDNPREVREMVASGRTAWLMDQSYNRSPDDSSGLVRFDPSREGDADLLRCLLNGTEATA